MTSVAEVSEVGARRETAAPVVTGSAVVRPAALSPEDRADWRALLALRPDSAPFVCEEWMDAWTTGFRPREPLFVCHRERGRLAGIGALQGLHESWGGRSIAVMQSLTNPESPRFEFVASGGRGDIHERLWRAVCETRRWDVVRVEHLPEDSPTLSAGLRVAADLGWDRVIEETFESPWSPLARPPASWDAALGRKFKANLRNRERRFERLGDVTFQVVRGGAEQRAALDLFYDIEASGWKGERGTAISARPPAKAFYDRLQDLTSRDLWIATLSVDGRAAAAQLIHARGYTLFLLKTAYDPEFAPYAPGQLLAARLIRYGIAQGMEILDFLGENMTWKRDWEPQLRRHYRLTLFSRSARGRYAYWVRHGIRETAKKIPGAVRTVRWLRSRRRPT